ncbi:hypothetical protein [Luethyella okanaganae]|uniref:Uncharacterized protein n=1 Tax=Luethyella okanaganae TaxID=69372 RepID=A0ABW1VF00_9MICO
MTAHVTAPSSTATREQLDHVIGLMEGRRTVVRRAAQATPSATTPFGFQISLGVRL